MMSCHDDVKSMRCVQIKSNTLGGLDKNKEHTRKTKKTVRHAEGDPWRREAPPTAEGGGAAGPCWGPEPRGVLLYTLLFNKKLAPGAFDLHDPIGTRMFHARLGNIKVDGNNPQG